MSGTASASHFDGRIVQTLEAYFGIALDADHPLMREIQTQRLRGGEWLMHQGDAGDSLFFLVHGRLQAWAAAPDGAPRGRFLNEIVAGDSVGELSLLTGAPRSVGIQAIRDSLLIRVDHETFERLAQQYPALALRLAGNIATLLQSTAHVRPSTRNLKTICLLPLDPTARSEAFCRDLAARLDDLAGRALRLAAGELRDAGAPEAAMDGERPVPEALARWLHEQEDRHRFVIYQGDSAHPGWTRFALRQSDLVVYVADTAGSPGRRPWEQRLEDTAGAAVARRMMVLLQPGGAPIRGTGAWLADRGIDFHVHLREDYPADIGRVARIVSGKALGLVLAGGAARGFAHLGVCRALQEHGVDVDWIGGTSLGAIMAGAIATPYSLDEAVELAREAFVRGKPFSDFTLPLVSLISGRRMQRLLRKHVNFEIEDLPTPFFCVSCRLDTGEQHVHERGNLADALCATAAIPGIIPPAVVGRRLNVDGAVINNLPVDIMRQKPVGTIVAVDLSSDKRVEVDYDEMPSAWAVLRGRYLPFARRYRVPALSTVLLKATELGTLERVRQLGRQADLLLQPEVRQFGMTEVRAFDRIVQAGYEEAMAKLPAWLEQRRHD